jgi:hypothetical protein
MVSASRSQGAEEEVAKSQKGFGGLVIVMQKLVRALKFGLRFKKGDDFIPRDR